MENKFGQWMDSLNQFLNDQPWFQQLKLKWEELDPQSQLYLKFSGIIGSVLLALILAFNFVWGVHKKKVELAEKTGLLHTIQSANDELRRLREATGGAAVTATAGEPWPAYLTNIATTAGIGKDSFNLSEERKGTSTDNAKESLFDVGLKRVNIRQIVRYAFSLENGNRPIKLRNLQIDTKGGSAIGNSEGYLDATFSVSAFTIQNSGQNSGQSGK